MTRKYKFTESFWGEDICSTKGYELLHDQLKSGEQLCGEFETFLQKRLKAEEDYGKALMDLAKSMMKNTKSNQNSLTMHASWQALLQQTEAIAKEHLSTSTSMTEVFTRLQNFMKDQKDKRKKEENTVKESAKFKINSYKKMTECKNKYNASSQEYTKIHGNMAVAAHQQNAKNIDKLQKSVEVAKMNSTKADEAYKHSVESVNQARQQWENDMTNLCSEFEKLEQVRLEFVQNEMWVFSNHISQTCVDVDECCETVRKSLEKMDIDRDIDQFVEDRKTGSNRPAKIEYEKYGMTQSSHTSQTLHRNPLSGPGAVRGGVLPGGGGRLPRQQYNEPEYEEVN